MEDFPIAFKREYDRTVLTVYQKLESELGPCVRHEPQSGEMLGFDYIGETEAVEDLPLDADTPCMNTPHYKRWVKMHSLTWADRISDLAKIQALIDPASDYLRVGIGALRRKEDRNILKAGYASVLTGKEADITVNAYDAGECRLINGDGAVVDAGSNFAGATETPLTVAKLQTISELMDDAKVPKEGRYFCANPYNKQMLQATTDVKSSDYNTVKALVNDEINHFMGFDFKWLPTDYFTVNATDTGCIQCMAWQRDAMLQTTGMEIKSEVSKLPNKNYNTQVWARSFKGNVRLFGPGVVLILLKKSR